MSGPRAEQFTSGKAVGVDVAAIERELAALWRQASDQQAVMRARCWNLAVYAQNDADFIWAREVSEALGEKVPTRTLLLHHEPDQPGTEVEAWVSARCKWAPGGGKLLCFEEITIETRGRGVQHLPSLVRALVESDTPTAVMWAGRPPAEAAVAGGLLKGADVLLVDSAHATDAGDLAQLELQSQLGQVAVADVQWLRAAPVREALAVAFEPPTPGGASKTIASVTVRCEKRALSSAKYLGGWLALRLAWGTPERIERGREAWMIPAGGRPVKLEVELSDAASACGVTGVEVTLESGAVLQVRAEGPAVTVEVPGGGTRLLATAPFKPGELLATALSGRGKDKLFAAALHRAVELDR